MSNSVNAPYFPPPPSTPSLSDETVQFMVLLTALLFGIPACIIASIAGFRLLKHVWISKLRRMGESQTWLGNRLKRSRQLQFASKKSSTIRSRLKFFLYSGPNAVWGMRWDVLQALLASLSCLLYIWGTYLPPGQCSTVLPAGFEQTFELVATLFFIADYILSLFLAKRRIMHMLSPVTFAELLTILPVFLHMALVEDITECNSSTFAFGRFLRLARFLRIVRVAKFMRGQDSDSFWHHIVVLCTSVVCIVLVSACTFQWAETIADDYELYFHQALYYMMIEVLGRPRLPVHTTQGYFIASALVLIVVVVVPWRLVRLAEALKRDSLYKRQTYVPKPREPHVILTGKVTVASMMEFISDFFHEDSGDHRTRVIILAPREPSVRMRYVLNQPAYASRVFYLQGSVDTPFDLERCRADVADAAFLLADKMPMPEAQQQRQDLDTISNVLTLKSYSTPACMRACPCRAFANRCSISMARFDSCTCRQQAAALCRVASAGEQGIHGGDARLARDRRRQ